MRYVPLLLAATMAGGVADAADFRFSFTSDTDPGIVTGIVYGLADSGTSAASRVDATFGGATADFSTLVQPIDDNAFTVANGTIIAFHFSATRGSRAGNYVASLQLGSSGPDIFQYVDFSPATRSFDARANGPDRVSFSALPEPADWALMVAGFGTVGTLLRGERSARRRAAEIG